MNKNSKALKTVNPVKEQENICLVEIGNGKIIPVLILEEKANDMLFVAQLRQFFGKKEKNTVYLGQPTGLKSESIAMAYKTMLINKNNIIKYLAHTDNYRAKTVLEQYNRIERIKKLHVRLHELKRFIFLAQFNNIDYRKEQQEIYDIISEIGYKNNVKYKDNYNGFREVPTNGRIKIYYGGR